MGLVKNAKKKRLCPQCEEFRTKDINILRYAAATGHLNCLKVLIREGADVNGSKSTGQIGRGPTALIVATEEDNVDCIQLLIKAGADVNIQDGYGNTALMHVVRHGRIKLVKFMIDAGADVNKKDIKEDWTALMYAVDKGNVDCLKLLIEEGADVNIQDSVGNTALIKAAEDDQVDCIKLLIEAGADVNLAQTANSRCTALMFVAVHGRHQCLRLLIEAGADVNRQDKHGDTALMRAARLDCFEWAGFSHFECVKLLIKSGTDVNTANNKGHTALTGAAGHCSDRCVDLLIKSGADVNAVDMDHRTALLWAADEGENVGCVRLLLRAGAKINTGPENVGGCKQNALVRHICFYFFSVPQVVKLLYAAGETVDGTTDGRCGGSAIIIQAKHFPSRLTKQCILSDYFKREDVKLNLKHLCRKTIRKHLINIDLHKHLFCRIPQLGLPSLVTEYLLYNVSLDDDNGNQADNKEDGDNYTAAGNNDVVDDLILI